MSRLQSRIKKVEAQMGGTAAKMYVTAAPAEMSAGDALLDLGITLGERDEHVHLRRFFGAGPAELISAKGVGHDRR